MTETIGREDILRDFPEIDLAGVFAPGRLAGLFDTGGKITWGRVHDFYNMSDEALKTEVGKLAYFETPDEIFNIINFIAFFYEHINYYNRTSQFDEELINAFESLYYFDERLLDIFAKYDDSFVEGRQLAGPIFLTDEEIEQVRDIMFEKGDVDDRFDEAPGLYDDPDLQGFYEVDV